MYQYHRKWRQSSNEIWSVNSVWHEKYFSWKIIHKMWWRNYSQAFLWKIKIKHLPGSILYSFIYFVLIVFQVEDYRKWFELSCRPFALTSFTAFLKNKKRFGTGLPALFSAWFLKKSIFVVIFYYQTKFPCSVALNYVRYWAICVL